MNEEKIAKPAVPSPHRFIQETVRRLGMLGIAAAWWVLQREGESTLTGWLWLDLISIGLCAWGCHRRGGSWQDGLFWGLISRRLHIDAMSAIEGFKPLLSVAWGLWCLAWLRVSSEEGRGLMLIYHASLTFDAGYSRPMGQGMVIGWESAGLDLMMLSVVLRWVTVGVFPSGSRIGRLVPLVGALWLLMLHRTGPSGHLSCHFLITSSLFFLVLFLWPGSGGAGGRIMATLAIGGLPLCLAAWGIGLADASSLAVFFQKRIFAGGLHPNLFAAWSLGLLPVLIWGEGWERLPKDARRVINALALIVYGATIVGAGSRIILLILATILGAGLASGVQLWASRGRLHSVLIWVLVAVAFVPIGFRIFQSASLMEWTMNERWFIWRSAADNIVREPWTGYGVFSYGQLPQRIDVEKAVWVSDWIYPHVHQIFLEMIVWGGFPLLGLALYVVFRRFREASKSFSGMSVSFISLLLAGQADFFWFTPASLFMGMTVLLGPSDPSEADGKKADGTKAEGTKAEGRKVEGAEVERRKVEDPGIEVSGIEVSGIEDPGIEVSGIEGRKLEGIERKAVGPVNQLMIRKNQSIAGTAKKNNGRAWLWPPLLIGLISGFSMVSQPLAFTRYRESLEAFQRKDPNWAKLLSEASWRSRLRIEPRLYRLMLKWTSGSRPDSLDKIEIRRLTEEWPEYYLPWFLLGRVCILEGKTGEAIAPLRRSLDLEPRDLSGIRWATLALAEEAEGTLIPALSHGERELGEAGQKPEVRNQMPEVGLSSGDGEPDGAIAGRIPSGDMEIDGSDPLFCAWNAVQRPSWGGPTILGHPDFGPGFREKIRAFCLMRPRNDVFSALQTLNAARSFLDEGERLPLPARSQEDRFVIPDGIAHYWNGLSMEESAMASDPIPLLASWSKNLVAMGISELLAVARIADRCGRFDLVASAADLVAERWNYRNKNDEDLLTPFLMARVLIEKGNPDAAVEMLYRVLSADPGNPWIIERLGDAHLRAGRLDDAESSFKSALEIVAGARLDPGFVEGPRSIFSQTGDHWTILFERAFRRHDPVCGRYHWARWKNFQERLSEKAAFGKGQ